MRKYKYFLFDLDGMMLNSDEGVFNSVAYALNKMGKEKPDSETLKKYMGPPLKYSFHHFSGLSEEESEQALRYYRERYSVTGLFEGYIFQGIPELLAELKQRGFKLGTATSKPEEFALRILEHFGIAKYFDIITGASFDDSRAHKHQVVEESIRRFGDSDRSKYLLIGDRKYDTEGAHACGIKCCGVYMDCAEEGEHEKAGADYIVTGVSGLSKLLLEQ